MILVLHANRYHTVLANDHTRLINHFIELCTNMSDHPLRDIAYKIQLIEQTLKLYSGDVMVPDVVVVFNQRSHILVVDCKCGKR